jgi:hypothetical protein
MNYAVVIGIDHYKTRPLNGAVNDAKIFGEWLRDNGDITIPDNLKILTSSDTNEIAMGHEIDKAIDDVIQDAKKNYSQKNRLYFYFSGHGMGITYDNTALCLREWPGWFHHCLSSSNYKAWFTNKAVFDEILIFLDCCRESDVFAQAQSPAPDWIKPSGDKIPDILICNSTIYKKLSYEIEGADAKRGAFTSFLIDAFSGDADSTATGLVTSLNLKNHVDANFENYAAKNGKIQKADVFTQGTNGNNIIICSVPNMDANYDCVITFLRSSKISLFGPDLEIKKGKKSIDVKTGESWNIRLGKGLFMLKDEITGETKQITNFSGNTISNEQF